MKNLYLFTLFVSMLFSTACRQEPGDINFNTDDDDATSNDDDATEPEAEYSSATLSITTDFPVMDGLIQAFPTEEGVDFVPVHFFAEGDSVSLQEMTWQMVGDQQTSDGEIGTNDFAELLEAANDLSSPGSCYMQGGAGQVSDSARVWDNGEFTLDALGEAVNLPEGNGREFRIMCDLQYNALDPYDTVMAVQLLDPSKIQAVDSKGLPLHPDNITLEPAGLNPNGVNRRVQIVSDECEGELLLSGSEAYCNTPGAATDAPSDGMLVQTPDIPFTYYYLDGARYPMPYGPVLESWYGSDCALCNDVYQMEGPDMAAIPLGAQNVVVKPGAFVMRVQLDDDNDSEQLYVVEPCRTLRPVTSTTAADIYGGSWTSLLRHLPSAFEKDYSYGPQLFDAEDFDTQPNVTLESELSCSS